MSGAKSDVWESLSLEESARAGSPIGYGIVQPGKYIADGVPVIAIRDLRRLSPERTHRSSVAIEAAYSRSRVRPGDVLISVKGTTGRIGIVPTGFEGNISRDVARLRLRDDQLPEYWFQMLQAHASQQALQEAAVGSTRQELSMGPLRRVRFRVPPLDEQEKVAEVLGGVDSLLAALELLLKKKRAVKLGMMKELLTGNVRLSGFTTKWKFLSIGDLATIAKGQQLGRSEMDELGTIPVWNGGVLPSGFTHAPNLERDVVTISEGGNSCGWVGRPGQPFWLGGHCYALVPRFASHSVSFLFQVLKTQEVDLMALRVGSGLPNIQKRSLAEFNVPVTTDRAEADAIASVLDEADREIAALERRLEATRAIKQGVMQELLTGHTRLVPEEASA